MKAIAKCRGLEGLVSRSQRYCERLQADLEACKIEKKGLQRQLEKAATDAVQTKEQSYLQGRSNTLGYLRKVVLTLASEFEDDQYFEAYLHFVDEREGTAAEGRDPEEVELIPPSTKGEANGDEATNLLEAEAGSSEGEDHADGGETNV